jgi:hypothetical protein
MSTPAPPAPTDPLREQLDELDALLQRMLELPVNPVDNDPRPLPAFPPLPPAPTTREPLPPLPDRGELRTQEAPLPSSVAVVEALTAPVVAPLPRSEPAPVAVRLPELIRRPPPPLVLWPLVGVNRVFDRVVSPLGFFGRWFRGRWGRTFLGWVGLLCLAAAAVLLLLDWIGWPW